MLSGQGTTKLKNEYSVSEELGYRYIGANLSASLTAFHYHFRNRQLATVIDRRRADQLDDQRRPADLLRARWRDRLSSGQGRQPLCLGRISARAARRRSAVDGDYLPTKGKHAVSSPTVQLGLGGTYDDGRLFGSFALKYVGRQYATFTNDESIKGYATLDLSIGVHLAGLIDAQRTDLRLNVINATNPHVLSGVEAISTNAQDTIGRNGTVIAGSAPAYYIGSGRAVVATISRAF